MIHMDGQEPSGFTVSDYRIGQKSYAEIEAEEFAL